MASISLSRELSSPRERPAPFSIQEFSDLVSSAFNLVPQAPSSSRPPHPGAPLHASGVLPSPAISCFDADTDDGHFAGSPRKARRSSAKPPMPSEQSPKSRSAFSVLRRVRSRASAALRPANTHLAPPSDAAAHSARPSICSQRTLQSTATMSSYSFLSRPPTPIPTPRTGSPFPDLALSRSRSRSKSLTGPISFLKLTKREPGASSTSPSQPPSAPAAPDTQNLPSFLDTTGYAQRNPQPPAYSRPSTPVAPLNAQGQSRIHTRLPPLRKAKSASTSLFRGKKPKGGRGAEANGATAGAQPRVALDWTMLDSEELFMSPRDPPPVPPLPCVSFTSCSPETGVDEDGELEVPAYVFERRGSATSTCTTSTTASSGSTSSLSERIASMFQSKAKLRARSKLSLAITTATADSSPSTDSTRTWSPVTPTGGFAFPSSSAARVCTQSENGHDTFEEDASKIGRVLTPEPDPFAKADVAIARFSTDVTPRPVSPVAKYGSRRGSRQDDRRARKARSAQQGWDFKDTSPDDVGDSPEVYSRVRGSGSLRRVRRRLPAFMMESPSPKSPIYEFPSSCLIYPARGEDAPQSPLLAGPAARTRANLVSRFSMSTESISSRSSFTESAEHQGLKDVDVDATFVFGSPLPVANADIAVAPGNASRSPSKRATLDVCASPKADQPTVRRSTTRASLPTSPPSAHARYAHCAASVLDVTTKRQASVRTSASEPSPRAHRPSSPFPLVRGISDGSPKGHLEAKLDDEMDTSVGSESADDSGVYSGVVLKDEAHRHDEEAFEDSFVLSGEDLERLPIPALSREKRGLAEEHRAFDTEDDALTPRPTSPAQSFLSVDAPSIEQKGPLEELDLTLTVGLAERDWDRHTTGTSGSSTESSMFFSARSSVESTRNSV